MEGEGREREMEKRKEWKRERETGAREKLKIGGNEKKNLASK